MSEGTRVFIALGAAIALGSAVAASDSTQAMHIADAIAPLGALWVTAIRMTVIPLVTALIVTGVASAASVKDIGRLGVRALLTFVGLLIGAACVVGIVAPVLFPAFLMASDRRCLPVPPTRRARSPLVGKRRQLAASSHRCSPATRSARQRTAR